MSPLGSASGGAFASAVRRVRHAAHSSAEPSLTGEAEADQGQGPQAAAAQGHPDDGAEAFGPEGVSATGRVEDAALPVPPQGEVGYMAEGRWRRGRGAVHWEGGVDEITWVEGGGMGV